MEITVRQAQRSDIPTLGRVLGLAFADDPIVTWLLPDAASRARRAATMFTTVARHNYFEHGGIDVAVDDSGDLVGVAMWAPPGHSSEHTNLRALSGLIRAFRGRLFAAGRMAEKMAAEHPHDPPHWYLASIGTLPATRGKGYGKALLSARLDRCDAEGLPAYLESSKPENVPYYERFGFEVTAELDATEGGPLMWKMWREPRS
ncbi:GNAT family N-acetyltransferase [Nocardia sp. NBC_01503]|uniref:GNAT family N-acetyltransferase n=1 Tax=Nocardia sp. NBC_01503 TaxID=2975997 RepID=UPI002E7C0494|nr:GNAT family N-acetyltransferase [Nocardia sp. NBC_01503]WTL31170.1 GNAT family N-acetyltransferase [Nocardia sp. NBC_01503]